MQRQAAPHAPGEEKPEPVASPPSGGVDELATLLATTSLLPPAPTNPDVLDPEDVVRRLIATALHRTDPERARREKLHGLPDPGELAPPRRGRQGELPGKSNEWLLAFTDEAELIAYLEREAGKRWSGWKEAHPRRRDVAARKSAAIGGALGAILGGDRTPEERAENERRREEAKRRARLMADADDDEEDGDMRDVLDEAYDDDDDDGGGE